MNQINNENSEHWLSVLNKLHKRLRFLMVAGAALFVLSASDWNSYQSALRNEARLIRVTIRDVSAERCFREEAQLLQQSTNKKNFSEWWSGGSDQGKYLIIIAEPPKNDSDL